MREAEGTLLPIETVARSLGLPDRYFERRGTYSGKVKLELLADPSFGRRGKLILVTATTPTASGEGKTVTAIGLAQGLMQLGKRAVVTSRQPSLGPIFGIKGGATGGGRSRIEPSEKINLHFHGDFHAIASAQNLLAALIDAHLFHGNELGLDPDRISWPRTLDMNDRALRQISVALDSQRDGAGRHTGFVITAACEIMAIAALATGRKDLRERLDSIVIGPARTGRPVRAKDLGATGGMMALLTDAILPNLVQTSEGMPALVHTGAFGNIAPGTSSVLSQDVGLHLADFVVNEVGFGADLGAEKYFDIVMRQSGIVPAGVVLVTTVQSMRKQGSGSIERGLPNLRKHVELLRGFGAPVIAALNRFPGDTDSDLNVLANSCSQQGVAVAVSEAFETGGTGARELAERVVETVGANREPAVRPLYSLDEPLTEKIRRIALQVYGAAGVRFSEQAKTRLEQFTEWGAGSLPVCMAKTQYSLSDDPKLVGAPAGWTLHVTDASLSAGAGFVVIVTGDMMLMPGLPRISRASSIDVDDSGRVINL